jgi:hypothetical protein
MTDKAKGKPTEYLILERYIPLANPGEPDTPAEAWVEVAGGLAANKAEAIKRGVAERPGVFKAVPRSSWKGGQVNAQETLLTSKPLKDGPDG